MAKDALLVRVSSCHQCWRVIVAGGRWQLVADDWYSGFFSRQYKIPPERASDKAGVPPQAPGVDRP